MFQGRFDCFWTLKRLHLNPNKNENKQYAKFDYCDEFYLVYVCVFIPSPVRVGTLLMEVPGTPIGASFFEFELKPTGKDSADPTQHEFQHHIV